MVEIANLFLNLAHRGIGIWKKGEIQNSYIRTLFVECRQNLKLLDLLNLDSESMQQDRAFLEITKHLSIESFSLVFVVGRDSSETDLAKALNKLVPINLGEGSEESDEAEGEREISALSAISEVILRVNAVKVGVSLLSNQEVREEGKGLKELRIKTRLRNIKELLMIIRDALKETTAVKELGASGA